MTDILTTNANNICTDAAILAGFLAADETLTDPNVLATLRRSLNVMLKSWQAKQFLWKLSDVEVTLTPGTQSYLVGPGGAGTLNRARPLRLSYCIRRTNGIDIEVNVISRQEYQLLPQKTQEGSVVSIYYDPQLTNGVLYPWYTGDSTNDTIICTFSDPIDILDNNTDSIEVPDEWVEPATYNLAVRACSLFHVSVPQEVALVAAESLDRMTNFDNDPAPIQFMPRSR
jgi:hypothetical protein